jgi:hypothetical protein
MELTYLGLSAVGWPVMIGSLWEQVRTDILKTIECEYS